MDKNMIILPDLTGWINEEFSDGMVAARNMVGGTAAQGEYLTNSHWHYDLEFLHFITDDRLYFVNGAEVQIKKGQALFINSCRLHRTVSVPQEGEKSTVVRINPTLITRCSALGSQLCDRKFGLNGPDYLVLSPTVDWQREIIEIIRTMPDRIKQRRERPLSPVVAALTLIDLTVAHLPDTDPTGEKGGQDQMIYLSMLEYIRNNFSKKIHTEDLAEAGHTSRAKVFRLFERFADCSPTEYLVRFRLSKSMELLRGTKLSILEISELCGFNTPSYYTSVFRKNQGMTPREFRQKAEKY